MQLSTLPSKEWTEYLATNSPEVDFALVLSRIIDALQENPSELRSAVYELARIKLNQEGWQRNPPIDNCEMLRLKMALETAIERVEVISARGDELRALKSLDRLIENLNNSGLPNSRDFSRSVLLIDHTRHQKREPNRLLAWSLLARRAPLALSHIKNFSLPLSQLRSLLQRGMAPAVRVCLVLIVAVALYATFGKFGFFRSQMDRSDKAAVSPPESMPELRAGIVLPRSPASTPLAEQDRPRGFPLPSVYGIYAISNGKLYELDALPGRVPDSRVFMSAIITKPSRTIVPDGHISFVAFRRDLATNAPERASVRVIAKVVQALTVSASGKANITPVDEAWAIRNVAYDFRVAPLQENLEMIILRPEAPDFALAAGRYGLVLNGVSYDFSVAGDVTDPAQCLERTMAANGTFYSECRQP